MLARGKLESSAPARGKASTRRGKAPGRKATGRAKGSKRKGAAKGRATGAGAAGGAGGTRSPSPMRAPAATPGPLTLDPALVDPDEDPYAEVKRIEQQMLLLKWRKAETDARIKNLLNETRQMQEQDLMVQLAADRTTERSQWMQRVIQQELQRPLTVDAEYLLALEEDERRENERARAETARHARVIQKLKRDVVTAAARSAPASAGGPWTSSPGSPSGGAFGGGVGGRDDLPMYSEGRASPPVRLPDLAASDSSGALAKLKKLEGIEKDVKKIHRRRKREAKATPLSSTLKKQ